MLVKEAVYVSVGVGSYELERNDFSLFPEPEMGTIYPKMHR